VEGIAAAERKNKKFRIEIIMPFPCGLAVRGGSCVCASH
jgi:hypothetical protein